MDTNNQYKLSTPSLPQLYELKGAHRELMQGYAETLAAISRLSFLVGLSEVRPPRESKFSKVTRNIFWGKYSIFRIFVWRPVVKLYAEAHIRKKLRELRNIYIQALHLSIPNRYERAEYQTWWKEAKEDCEQFAATLNSGAIFYDVFKLVLLLVANFLVAAWGANSLSDLGVKIVSSEAPVKGVEFIVKLIIFTIFATPIILTLVESTFTTKRDIFLNINSSKQQAFSIYQLENKLFDLLGYGKSLEVPIDFFVGSFFLLSTILYVFLLGKALEITVQVGQGKIWSIPYLLCLTPFLFFLFIKNVIVEWQRRDIQRDL